MSPAEGPVLDVSIRNMRGGSLTSLDDWCDAHERNKAEFTSHLAATRAVPEGHKYVCNLSCYHNGNFVSARGTGPRTGDAFLAAIVQIELTIGTAWRSK